MRIREIDGTEELIELQAGDIVIVGIKLWCNAFERLPVRMYKARGVFYYSVISEEYNDILPFAFYSWPFLLFVIISILRTHHVYIPMYIFPHRGNYAFNWVLLLLVFALMQASGKRSRHVREYDYSIFQNFSENDYNFFYKFSYNEEELLIDTI